MLVYEPPGRAVTMTVVNSGGIVITVEPAELVVVNETAEVAVVDGGTA